MTRNFVSLTSVAALLLLTSTGAYAAKSPQEFLKDAIQGDNSEIALGQLAQQKASNAKVKDFGKTLVSDHTVAKQEASTLAKTLGVTPSDEPTAEAKDEQDKLSKLSGADFDKEFASYMVKDHQKDIQEFQDQAKANDQTSALANKQLPTLQKHLQMAQALAGSTAQNGTEAPAALKEAPTQEAADQWRASKLAGVAVYGPDNKKVGSITDVLMTQEGKAEYVVVGVGGFLGIGEKDVAIPYDQVKFTDQPVAGGANAGNSGATTTAATGNGMAPAAPAMTMSVGNTANGTPVTPPPAGTAASAGSARTKAYPDHGMIDMTADQLKSAPTFKFNS